MNFPFVYPLLTPHREVKLFVRLLTQRIKVRSCSGDRRKGGGEEETEGWVATLAEEEEEW